MGGFYTVQAETLEDAAEKIYDADAPFDKLPEGEYIDDTFKVFKSSESYEIGVEE